LKPGWRWVKLGDVVRLSKARSQDPLADGIERYVGLEHLEPSELRIVRIRFLCKAAICRCIFDGLLWPMSRNRTYGNSQSKAVLLVSDLERG
jgi:hypothetical protein